jgi:uncharacterized protein (DUF1800 family)
MRTEREKGAHLLRRFGLGASEAELDYYLQGGLNGAVEKLLGYEKTPEVLELDLRRFAQRDNNRVNMVGVQSWWTLKLITTRRPLLEKMTLFWHDHFATSASKVNQPPFMYQQNELLRRGATGSFRDLLLSVSQDPAMLFWLDNQYNVKGKPNENFAREIMELFTLGIGNYTEKDVQEAARAFTGWTYRRTGGANALMEGKPSAEFLFRRNLHDADPKTVLGTTKSLSGEDVIDMLCDHPQTAKYITTKLWEWFAYPKPEKPVIDRLAGRFRTSELNIGALLRDIMTAPEFYSDKAYRAVVKNPVDFVVPTLRQAGLGESLAAVLATGEDIPPLARGAIGAVQQTTRAMGMMLLFPPDVDGWPGGDSWISSATMVERIAWGERLFGQSAGGRRLQVRAQAFPLFSQDPSPEGAVRRLLAIFDAPLPESKIPPLVAAAKSAAGGAITQRNANAVAGKVCRLIFGSPEFQFA